MKHILPPLRDIHNNFLPFMVFKLVIVFECCDERYLLFTGQLLIGASSLPILGPPGYGPT